MPDLKKDRQLDLISEYFQGQLSGADVADIIPLDPDYDPYKMVDEDGYDGQDLVQHEDDELVKIPENYELID